tara:strand:- start:301 stop:1455 length:1155 start_codon:yes stop_codon:yes gene_type:complete
MIENYQPKMTNYLVNNTDLFKKRKVVIVDVGARYGCNPLWENAFGDNVEQIGFEPDLEEFKKLNEGRAKRNTINSTYYPVALHKDIGKRTFYLASNPAASGFYKPDINYWNRFQHEQSIIIKETNIIETIDFDSFAIKNGVEYVDFIKLDVEGAEFDVLKGCNKYLREGGVKGVVMEFRFHESSNQPTFADTDNYMRDLGFRLFDIDLMRSTRKTLAAFPVKNQGKMVTWGMPCEIGQLFAGNALYFRDAVAEIKCDENNSMWDENSILKLISFYEVFGLPDCAIELLQFAGKSNLLNEFNIDHLTNLLTPKYDGNNVTYRKYIEILNKNYLQKIDERYNVSIMTIINKDIKLILYRMLYSIISLLPTKVKNYIYRLKNNKNNN